VRARAAAEQQLARCGAAVERCGEHTRLKFSEQASPKCCLQNHSKKSAALPETVLHNRRGQNSSVSQWCFENGFCMRLKTAGCFVPNIAGTHRPGAAASTACCWACLRETWRPVAAGLPAMQGLYSRKRVSGHACRLPFAAARRRHTSLWPLVAAQCRGESPWPSVMETLTPEASRIRTISAQPWTAGAEQPVFEAALLLLHRKNIRLISDRSTPAATCSGVTMLESPGCGSTWFSRSHCACTVRSLHRPTIRHCAPACCCRRGGTP
jgi:hypothetical protein